MGDIFNAHASLADLYFMSQEPLYTEPQPQQEFVVQHPVDSVFFPPWDNTLTSATEGTFSEAVPYASSTSTNSVSSTNSANSVNSVNSANSANTMATHSSTQTRLDMASMLQNDSMALAPNSLAALVAFTSVDHDAVAMLSAPRKAHFEPIETGMSGVTQYMPPDTQYLLIEAQHQAVPQAFAPPLHRKAPCISPDPSEGQPNPVHVEEQLPLDDARAAAIAQVLPCNAQECAQLAYHGSMPVGAQSHSSSMWRTPPTPVSVYTVDLCRIVRGSSSASAMSKPPASPPRHGHYYAPVKLAVQKELLSYACSSHWSDAELEDKRRIVRVECTQDCAALGAGFRIVGLATKHPAPEPAPAGVSVIEVSCLQKDTSDCGIPAGYYITSVEVIGIVETLINASCMDPAQRRRERGRIRSNLMPFWQKRPLLAKSSGEDFADADNAFARRIMAYSIRKPRGFDKNVRVLHWDHLGQALERALQCYYVEVPLDKTIE